MDSKNPKGKYCGITRECIVTCEPQFRHTCSSGWFLHSNVSIELISFFRHESRYFRSTISRIIAQDRKRRGVKWGDYPRWWDAKYQTWPVADTPLSVRPHRVYFASAALPLINFVLSRAPNSSACKTIPVYQNEQTRKRVQNGIIGRLSSEPPLLSVT